MAMQQALNQEAAFMGMQQSSQLANNLAELEGQLAQLTGMSGGIQQEIQLGRPYWQAMYGNLGQTWLMNNRPRGSGK